MPRGPGHHSPVLGAWTCRVLLCAAEPAHGRETRPATTALSHAPSGVRVGHGVVQSLALRDTGNLPHAYRVDESKSHEPPGWQ